MRAIIYGVRRTFSQAVAPVVNLRLDEKKKTATITLSNPKKRNTLSLDAIKHVQTSLRQVQQQIQEKKTKILIIEGEGPVFCSGHDLKQLSSCTNPQQIFDQCAEMMLRIHNLPIPTLCVINGIAAAAGFQLAMACDLVVATEKSSFSTPGVKWGLFCSTPAVELIRSINSHKKAMEMLMFGQSISAQEAYQYGLLNRVVPETKLTETVNQFVTKANNLSSQVIAHGKATLRAQKHVDVSQAYCIAGKGMHENITGKQDCKQGLKAFSEKRHPHYKN